MSWKMTNQELREEKRLNAEFKKKYAPRRTKAQRQTGNLFKQRAVSDKEYSAQIKALKERINSEDKVKKRFWPDDLEIGTRQL